MHAGTHLNPLLCRSPLLAGESLPSYLIRLAAANCYEPHLILTRACNKRLSELGFRDNLNHPRHPETFDLLSSLTRISPGELANASVHRFSQTVPLDRMENPVIYLSDGQPQQLLDTRLRSKKLWRDDQAQFCPECLREAPYHRLAWMPLEVTTCLKHKCLLVKCCQRCNALVGIRDIVANRCRDCDADLREVAPLSIQDKPFELFAQRMIQAWWGLTAPPTNPSTWALPAKPVSVLYRLFEGLTDSLRARWRTEYLHQIIYAVPSTHEIQTAAFRGMVNWPLGFYELLGEYLQNRVPNYRYDNPIYAKLGRLYTHWLSYRWLSSEFEFVQETFDQFLVEHHPTLDATIRCMRTAARKDLPSKFPYVSIRRAVIMLGTTDSVIENLARSGAIRTYTAEDDDQLCVSQEDVLELKNRWAEGITSSEAVQLLGVSSDAAIFQSGHSQKL